MATLLLPSVSVSRGPGLRRLSNTPSKEDSSITEILRFVFLLLYLWYVYYHFPHRAGPNLSEATFDVFERDRSGTVWKFIAGINLERVSVDCTTTNLHLTSLKSTSFSARFSAARAAFIKRKAGTYSKKDIFLLTFFAHSSQICADVSVC